MKARNLLLFILLGIYAKEVAAQVSGNVFHDFNQNNLKEATEENLSGIIVTAFNSAGMSVMTTTGTNGNYSFPNSGITVADTIKG